MYFMGGNLVYNYVQERHVNTLLTNTFAVNTPISITAGVAVWLDGLLRTPGAGANQDYTASPSAIMFNYNITAN